jgi:hypothetical protein
MAFDKFNDGDTEGANVNLTDPEVPSRKAKVSAQRDLKVSDTINTVGANSALIVGTVAVEIKVGSSRLVGRKTVTLHNNSNRQMFWGYSNAVTISNGTPIEKGEFLVWAADDETALWVISDASGQNARITEA